MQALGTPGKPSGLWPVVGTVSGVTHPLHPMIVEAVEKAATEHRGRAWVHSAFTDLNHRATHPCGIFTSMPFSVFAKLDISPIGEEQFAAELSGFGLIRSRTPVATPVPVAGGLVVTGAGTLLLSEALPERGAASGQAAEGRVAGDYAAIGHALASLHQVRGESFGLAEFNGFFGPLPQPNQPVSSGTWAEFYAERRVQPMLRLAVNSRYLPSELAHSVERVAARLPVLSGPDPVPALLHGDAQQNNFVSTADGAVAIDVAPYFGHPEADLALVDNYSPVDPALFRAYMESAPIDPGFPDRRELWRLHSYLAAIAFHGADAIDSFLPRIDSAVRQYA